MARLQMSGLFLASVVMGSLAANAQTAKRKEPVKVDASVDWGNGNPYGNPWGTFPTKPAENPGTVFRDDAAISGLAHLTKPAENPGTVFGIRMGQSLEGLTIVRSLDTFQNEIKVPFSHPAFSTYAVFVTPKAGICTISAVSDPFNHDKSMALFISVRDELIAKYGTSKIHDNMQYLHDYKKNKRWNDYIKEAQIYSENRIMAFYQWISDFHVDFIRDKIGERRMEFYGISEDEMTIKRIDEYAGSKKLPAYLQSIELVSLVNKIDSNMSSIRIRYKFSNIDGCMKEGSLANSVL